MNRQVLGVIAFTFLMLGATAPHVCAESANPRLDFVTEYIREISAQENIRANAEKEIANVSTQGGQSTELRSGIHASTLMQIELRSDIQMLSGMHLDLDPSLNKLIPSLIKAWEEKVRLHQRMIDISSAFVAAGNIPKPGVHYRQMVAEMPKLRAYLESIDQTVMKGTPLVFLVLVDPRPDSKNQLSHLLITKAERAELLRSLTSAFGEKLEEKDAGYASAVGLKIFLSSKNYKCADELWE
jgi:hypothetical protein